MKVLSWEEFIAGGLKGHRLALTIGVFDGLHIGHRRLIDGVVSRQDEESAVFTFTESPKKILSPQNFTGELSTMRQKLALVAASGADFTVLIDFSGDFSKLPGRQFLSMLRDSVDLRYIAVGADFRCGHHLDTDVEGIRAFCSEHGIGMTALEEVNWSVHPVSSSRIRKAIREARLEDAQAMLGRGYELDLLGLAPWEGDVWKLSRGQIEPPAGMYEAVLVFADGHEKSLEAEHTSDGTWRLGDGSQRPAAVRLLHLVSRE